MNIELPLTGKLFSGHTACVYLPKFKIPTPIMQTSRVRAPIQPGFKLPYWFKPFYDLSLPGDKADIAKILHRVIYRCHEDMKASHRTVLAFIFDRTIGWDKFFERITYDQIQHGVFDRDGHNVAHGTNLSRRTISRCLDELISWGVLLRRIETGCKTQPRFYYALNLGAGVGVKNRNGDSFICSGVDYLKSIPKLFQPEKQVAPAQTFTIVETVFENGRTVNRITNTRGEIMLAVPKRLKQSIGETTLSIQQAAMAEFGEAPEVNSEQFTNTPANEPDRFNNETERTHNLNPAEVNTEPACAGVPAIQTIEPRLRAKTHFEKVDAPIDELEEVWKSGYKECFDSIPFPWGSKEKSQARTLLKKWEGSGRKDLNKAMLWWIQRWKEVGMLFFNPKPNDPSSYPQAPSLGYLLVCIETFTRAYENQDTVDDVPGMSERELFVARLKKRGWSNERVEALAEKKFKPETPKPKASRKQWEEMIAEHGRRANLQPVANVASKPIVSDVVLDESKFKLEVWK